LFGIELKVVAEPPEQADFGVLPKRWIVERTFASLVRHRLLRSD